MSLALAKDRVVVRSQRSAPAQTKNDESRFGLTRAPFLERHVCRSVTKVIACRRAARNGLFLDWGSCFWKTFETVDRAGRTLRLPVTLLDALFYLSLCEVALQGAQVADEQLAVEMIGFV